MDLGTSTVDLGHQMTEFLSPLVVSPISDGVTWFLCRPFFYLAANGRTIEVPERFLTDFASIPSLLTPVLPRWSRYGPGAVLHDAAYWWQTGSRREADDLFWETMTALNVTGWKRLALFWGVRLGGWWAWHENARMRARGITRMQPHGARWPAEPTFERFRWTRLSSWRPGLDRRGR
jgi:hypothetical protein